MQSDFISNRTSANDSLSPQDLIVGVFDVLGFKSKVHGSDLAQLVNKYRHVLKLKDWSSEIPVLSSRGVVRWHTRTGVFSDTIVLWSRTDLESVDTFLSTC